jgi:hypothetical protein
MKYLERKYKSNPKRCQSRQLLKNECGPNSFLPNPHEFPTHTNYTKTMYFPLTSCETKKQGPLHGPLYKFLGPNPYKNPPLKAFEGVWDPPTATLTLLPDSWRRRLTPLRSGQVGPSDRRLSSDLIALSQVRSTEYRSIDSSLSQHPVCMNSSPFKAPFSRHRSMAPISRDSQGTRSQDRWNKRCRQARTHMTTDTYLLN